jgi:penicillin amidase
MPSPLRQRLRLLASIVSVLVLIVAMLAGWFYWKLRASLPQLDGVAALPGLTAPVTVTRDALGVPTIRGASRVDVARALGYLHAQDRFFQMDTLRRRSAGELSELVGAIALPLDKASRLHGFRALAKIVLGRSSPAEQALVQAYTAGVNAGLAALGAKPIEYFALRTEPKPWLPEDCLLVNYSMVLDLEDSTGNYERSLTAVRDLLGSAAVAFFAPVSTPDDAAVDGTTAAAAPMPTDRQLDLRKRSTSAEPAADRSAPRGPTMYADYLSIAGKPPAESELSPGSNNFALAGNRTASGGALLANDMHLGLRVPNTWYRASFVWPDHHITGVTLPGVPFLIAGSNEHIAWGFTAAYTDRSDLVVVPVSSSESSLYTHDGKLVEFETRREKILVKGGTPVDSDTRWTVWGPVIGTDDKGNPLALHWVAHDPDATNLSFAALETATTADEGVAIIHRAGVTALNFLVADAAGQIAWTVAGRLPNRFGFDGQFPVSWVYGDRGWNGFVPPDDVPTVRSPASGQLWTSNNRVVGGAGLTTLGDGGYELPPRAAQIRDDLTKLTKATPEDLLKIQLDDRAIFLTRWQQQLLATLTPAAIAQKKSRADVRALVEQWGGYASVDSVSYRLVRAWRTSVASLVFQPLFAPCVEAYPDFNWYKFQYEGALWTMLQEKPAHLLNPRFGSWDELLLAAVDEVTAQLEHQNVPLAHATWGQRNTAHINHPLASALPAWLTGWLNMPADQLPGDSNMPRVQGPAFGASERFVVSPGREAEGIFHMPGGQSGHPLSPYYRAGHAAWVHGEATPFLPGKTEHTLELRP